MVNKIYKDYLEFKINDNIQVYKDSHWDFLSPTPDWAQLPPGEWNWSTPKYNAFIGDSGDSEEIIDYVSEELSEYIPEEPGEYHISASLVLGFTVYDVKEYIGNDVDWNSETGQMDPVYYPIMDTEDASAEYSPEDSQVLSIDIKKVK